MIKLESANKIKNEAFYFETIEDCERFKYVFKDHWTGVKWKKPVNIEIKYIPYEEIKWFNKYKTPEEYAEANLSWAFNSLFVEEPKLSKEQDLFVQTMVNRIIND